QFLKDGGHYERSPMYHSIALEDLLDVCNLLERSNSQEEKKFLKGLKSVANQAIEFLVSIVGADKKIPLFNDSAYGVAIEPFDLFSYAERVLGYQESDRLKSGFDLIELPYSGYFGYKNNADSFLIDCGDIAPDYQPGHGHCDTLSYVLCLDGKPLIIDSGISGYDEDDYRSYFRGTSAHNTVSVNDQEQSEIWGTFRVARRARAQLHHFRKTENGILKFSGSHSGYKRLSPSIEHHRDVIIDTQGCWEFYDVIEGRGYSSALSFIHFHPSISLSKNTSRFWDLSREGQKFGRLIIADELEATEKKQPFSPEFGVNLTHSVLIIPVSGTMPLKIHYVIEKVRRNEDAQS
ncbi:MAG: alginate lyase family protein, partial [Pseudomonadota bacterium]|nr:alginate lyase family protein [Pseudomonadota bacterium]